MPSRTLAGGEYDTEHASTGSIERRLRIINCSNPTTATNVAVNIRVHYANGTEASFFDHVNITAGRADHGTGIGNEIPASESVVIVW